MTETRGIGLWPALLAAWLAGREAAGRGGA
jgi:hypothetical protein